MLPFGVTFYPDQWPVETWEENFRNIKKAGFNIVRFNEMAWDWIEPEPGKFNWPGLDRALDICAKNGLKVLLGIPTSQVPTWFYRLYPNSRPVAQDGTLYPEFGPRPNVCKDNPRYRRLAERLTRKLVARYKNHPAVGYWQVDNEPVYPPLDHTTQNDFCHCEDSRHAFIAWTRARYGSLNKLNEVWGTIFWTNHLASWEDIRTPKAGIWEAVSPHTFLDWFRFKSASLRGWIGHLAKIVRSLDQKHPVGTNGFIGICTRVPDHSRMCEGLDWYGLDIYPKGGRMDERGLSFMLDIWRSFTRAGGAEFHVTEMQGGQNVRWGCPDYVVGPELKGWTKQAYQRGAKALLYHAWRPPLFGAETAGFGILKTDGSATPRLKAVKECATELPTYKQLKPATIAIAYLRGGEVQSYQEQGPPRGISGQWEAVRTDIGLTHALDSASGAYQLVYKKNSKELIDFIFDQDLESGKLPYKTILLPNPYLLSRKQHECLKKWVSAGGHLITEARYGQKDENGHLYPTPLIEDLLGVTYDHGEVNEDGFLDVIEGKGKKPQLITKKIGKGKILYANFSVFLGIRKSAVKQLSALKKFI